MAAPGLEVLQTLQNNFGGVLYKRNRNSVNPDWQDAYSWELLGKSKLRPALQNIVNHLEIKKEQAKLLIWILDDVQGKIMTHDVRDRLKEELKAMKRDPQRLSEKAISEIGPLIPERVGEVVLQPGEIWSKKYNLTECIGCGKSDRKPHSYGLCTRCSDKKYSANRCDSLAAS